MGWLTPVVVALALAFLPGCGPGQKRRPLSGTVSLRGKPLETGHVTFLKDATPAVPLGGALIRDGRFDVPAEQGLEPGRYKVAVSSPQGVGERTPEQIAAGASTPAKERIPARYNAKTQLAIEVTEGGPNHFDLKLD